MSDIDLLPVYAGDTAPDGPPEDLDRRRAELVDWWAASGRAQTLDLAWLCFTAGEIGTAMAGGARPWPMPCAWRIRIRWRRRTGCGMRSGRCARCCWRGGASGSARWAGRGDGDRAGERRDQPAAFTVHVVRHRPDLDGPWTAVPDPRLGGHLAELRQIAGGL